MNSGIYRRQPRWLPAWLNAVALVGAVVCVLACPIAQLECWWTRRRR